MVYHSSNPINSSRFALPNNVVLLHFVANVALLVLPLSIEAHLLVLLSNSDCLLSLLLLRLLCFSNLVSICPLNILQLLVLLVSFLLDFLLFGLFQKLSLLLILLHQVLFFLFAAKDGLSSVLGDLLEFMLLDLVCLRLLGFLVLIECEVLISYVFNGSVHDIALARLHLRYLIFNKKLFE